MATIRTLDDLGSAMPVEGLKVLVRADLNLPMADGQVTDATRIERLLPTLKELAGARARVAVLSHFGRPRGKRVPEMSLAPVAAPLGEALGQSVVFAEDCIGPSALDAIRGLAPGGVLLLENTRFHAGEKKNDAGFAHSLAELGDVFVHDAFSCAHRAHASTEGLTHILPSFAGRGMEAELKALGAALTQAERPVMAVVGGSKVSTKLALLENLVEKMDVLVIGGGMANTFLAAKGLAVGKSLCEHDLLDTAKSIMSRADRAGAEILLPTDVVLARSLEAGAETRTAPAEETGAEEMILDLGPASLEAFKNRLDVARTVVWNGPLGAFEFPPFDTGTVEAARAVAKRTGEGDLVSVAGGGDTVAALAHAGVVDAFTYVSAAGGAFLEWLEGRTLPGVAALESAAERPLA